jgi:DHA2 family multidrug resistance protein
MTLPRELRGDGAALFSMFRNVFGSIGISLSTAEITQRSQVHQTYLSQWASPFHQPYLELISTYERSVRAMGHGARGARDVALGFVYQDFRDQVAVLAYADVFYYCSIIALLIVPFCFLISSKMGNAGRGGGH